MRTLATFALSLSLLGVLAPLGALAQGGPPPLPAPTPAPPPLPPAPTGAQYYYDDNGKPAGPYSADEIGQRIAAGQITAATLIWKTGTPSWLAAKDLPEFAIALGGGGGAAQDVSFDAVSSRIGGLTIAIPHVAIKGSSLSKGVIQGLFNGPWSLSTADTLARFDAASVVIPEIRLELAMPPDMSGQPNKASAVYRDLRLDDVKNGKAARLSLAGLTVDIPDRVPVNVSVGAILATDYDLAGAVRVAFAAAAPGEAQKQIAGPASIEGLRATMSSDFDLSIGKVALGAVKLRPLSMPAATVVQTLVAAGIGGQPLAPAEAARMIDAIVDFYEAFAFDGLTVSEVSAKIPDHKFRPLTLKTFKLGPISNSRYAEIGIEGLDVTTDDGHVRLGRLALLGLDLKSFLSTMAALTKRGDLGPAAMRSLDWHGAAPHLDGVVVKGLDLAPPNLPGAVTLAGFELKLGNYVGGIPTVLRAELSDLVIGTDLLYQKSGVHSFGYDKLDLSSLIDLAWDESGKVFRINEISAKGADMGAASLKAALGNVPRELFAGTRPQMQVAALGVTLSGLSLRLEDAGLANRIVAEVAKDQGKSPDALRLEWGTYAQLGIPQVLGGSDEAKALARAVAAFIVKPKSLSIAVKAKGAGLGVSDVVGDAGGNGKPNPVAIFNKLEVTATANE